MVIAARPLRRAMIGAAIAVTLCVVPLSSTHASVAVGRGSPECSGLCGAAERLPTGYGATSAVSADDVWVVGTDSGDAAASHWNGKTWHSKPPESPGAYSNFLRAVDARAVDDVWAVGESLPDQLHLDPLIEHWDGSDWQVVPSPRSGTHDTSLQAVSADAADDAWVVGFTTYAGSNHVPVAEHWDGSEWHQVPVDDTVDTLYGVEAVSPTDAWAVGHYHRSGPHEAGAAVVHWDGVSWSVVERLISSGRDLFDLSGVVASGPDDVWAVGTHHVKYSEDPLVVHWDGTQWSEVRPTLHKNAGLEGVTVDGAGGVVVVGYVRDYRMGPSEPLVLRWDGARWARDRLPQEPEGSYLGSVTSPSPDRAWAVGSRSPGALLLSWDGTSWHE